MKNIFALLSIVLGAVGMFLGLFGLIPLAAIILGVIALNQKVEGIDKTLSIIGIILGAVGVLYVFMVLM